MFKTVGMDMHFMMISGMGYSWSWWKEESVAGFSVLAAWITYNPCPSPLWMVPLALADTHRIIDGAPPPFPWWTSTQALFTLLCQNNQDCTHPLSEIVLSIVKSWGDLNVLSDKTDSGLLSFSCHPQDTSECRSQGLLLLLLAYCT